MILDEGCNHKGWRLVEVYDDTQIACGPEIATKEPLASGCRIAFADIRSCDRVEYCLYVAEHLRTTSCQMLFGA